MAIRLLEKDYAAIQAEIKERQKLYMERRQIYMDYVIQDHQDEMAKFNLQRQKSSSSVHDVDSKFLRCYSAKVLFPYKLLMIKCKYGSLKAFSLVLFYSKVDFSLQKLSQKSKYNVSIVSKFFWVTF